MSHVQGARRLFRQVNFVTASIRTAIVDADLRCLAVLQIGYQHFRAKRNTIGRRRHRAGAEAFAGRGLLAVEAWAVEGCLALDDIAGFSCGCDGA